MKQKCENIHRYFSNPCSNTRGYFWIGPISLDAAILQYFRTILLDSLCTSCVKNRRYHKFDISEEDKLGVMFPYVQYLVEGGSPPPAQKKFCDPFLTVSRSFTSDRSFGRGRSLPAKSAQMGSYISDMNIQYRPASQPNWWQQWDNPIFIC